jgi:hypothetical protein
LEDNFWLWCSKVYFWEALHLSLATGIYNFNR